MLSQKTYEIYILANVLVGAFVRTDKGHNGKLSVPGQEITVASPLKTSYSLPET